MRQLSIRQTALDVVKSLPETASLEEIMYQINLAAQTLEGLEDVKQGRTMTSAELLSQVDQWKKNRE